MKLNFKKISAIATSALMIVSGIGFAAAANYPAPFVQNGLADVAIVYGTGEGVSHIDLLQSGNIQSNLQSYMTGTESGGSSSSGGDSFKIEKTSTKWHLGQALSSVMSRDLTDDDLPTLLVDGVYTDDGNTEYDYSQKIKLSQKLNFSMWDDKDYKEDAPTIGIKIPNGDHVLNYTINFAERPDFNVSTMETTNLNLMGKNYYILDLTGTAIGAWKLTLLDTASSGTVQEGETITISTATETYDVSINFISTTQVKLDVDGELTNALSAGSTYKLNDGSYLGIKEILARDVSGSIGSCEFSIGKGKLEIDDGDNIKINDDVISEILGTYTVTSGELVDLTLEWRTDDDEFIAPESELLMPGFEAIKFTYGGYYTPTEETFGVTYSGDTWMLDDVPMIGSTEDISLLYTNGTHILWIGGGDHENTLVTVNGTTGATGANITFDSDTDDYWVASWSDGNDAESYLMRAGSFTKENGINKTNIQYRKNGEWVDAKTKAQTGEVVSIGNVELQLGFIFDSSNNVTVQGGNTNVRFDRLYTKEGLAIYLPVNVSNSTGSAGCGEAGDWEGAIRLGLAISGNGDEHNVTGHNSTSFYLTMSEENKDDGKLRGGNVTFVLAMRGTSPSLEPTVNDIIGENETFAEIGTSDIFRSFLYTALGTEILWDKSQDQRKATVTYHGGESYGEFYITAPNAVITSGESGGTEQLGDVIVTDKEISSVGTKNLIVVGGSCINSAAATLVGGAHCGADFTEATGVGSGQFLVKGYDNSAISTKLALLVAGYNVDDTVNAATYLRNQKPDTTKEWLGTTGTSAVEVTE